MAFELPRDLSWAYRELGIDLPKLNQSERFELPVPATFVVSAAEETSAAPPQCVPTAPRVHLRRGPPWSPNWPKQHPCRDAARAESGANALL